MAKKIDFFETWLKGIKKGYKLALETSIRTGVPLVFEKNGKIIEVKPKYKYIKVPIKPTQKKSKSIKKLAN